MADVWSTNTDDWSVDEDTVEIENPEFVDVTTDANGKVLHGILKDGDFYFGNGVPSQIQGKIEERIVETVKDIKDRYDGEINILFFGNSLSLDVTQYLPWIFKTLCPDVKFKIIQWYAAGRTLSEHLELLEDSDYKQTIFSFDSEKYSKGWVLTTAKNELQTKLSNVTVNHVVLQEYSTRTDYDEESYSGIIDALREICGYDVKFHHLVNKPYVNLDRAQKEATKEARETAYNKAVVLARDVWNNQPIDSVVNPGTAFMMAFDNDDLWNVITSDTTYVDYTHAEDGIPCYIQNMLVAQWIFNLYGLQASIIDENLILTKEIWTKLNVQGKQYGDNGPIFGTADEQRLAQIVAQRALNKVGDIETGLSAIADSKVDKVEGKSLIDEDYADECAAVEDSMWLEATTDSDNKILEGITADGEKVIDIPVSVLGNKLDYIKNPEFSGVLLDNEGKLIEAMTPNGKHYLALPTNQDEVIIEEVNKLSEEQKKEKFIDISRDNFNYHEECIFHDDFVRETQDSNKPWIIGSNSSAVNLDKYDYTSIYDNDADDGFRLSESSGEYRLVNVSSQINGFRLVKNLTKSSSIVVEINNETLINKYQAICFNVDDANNYELFRVHRSSITNLIIEYIVATNGVEIHKSIPIEQKYNGNAIRFYFIQKQLRILLDDIIVFTGEINNGITNLGLYVDSSREYSYKFFNVYYVQTNRIVTDNTGSVDKQITEGVTFTVGQSKTIDTAKEYCYTLVDDVVDFGYCERFEVRNNGALTVTDDRQENMFIPQKLPILCKWILSFDLMFPSDFVVDEPVSGSTNIAYDCFFQLHESAADAMSPCIILTSEPSDNSESGAGIFVKIESLIRQVNGFYNPNTSIKKEIYSVERGKWHHFDIMCKQGYLAEHNPLTIVKVDGKEVFRSVAPNAYNVAKQDYPKYGMYKPMWSGGRTTSTNKRVIYFDNVKITY